MLVHDVGNDDEDEDEDEDEDGDVDDDDDDDGDGGAGDHSMDWKGTLNYSQTESPKPHSRLLMFSTGQHACVSPPSAWRFDPNFTSLPSKNAIPNRPTLTPLILQPHF